MNVLSILKRKVFQYNCVLTKKDKICDCEKNEDCFECRNKKKCLGSFFGNVYDLILHYLEIHFLEENKILGVIQLSKKIMKKKMDNKLENIPDMDYFAFFKEEQKSILKHFERDCVNFEEFKIEKKKKKVDFMNNKLLSNLNVIDKKIVFPKNLNSRSKRMFVNTFSVKKNKKKVITKNKKESFVNTYDFFNL